MKVSTAPTPSDSSRPGGAIREFAPPRSFLSRFQRWEWMLIALILIGSFILNGLTPHFLNAENIWRTSSGFMEIGLMMLPMVLIIITGNIDLAVASNLGMCASFMGVLFMSGTNIWVAAAASLLLGMVGGLLNGILVARVKLPALVVTLGTYAFYRGVAFVLLGDKPARGYPDAFTYLGQGKLPGTLIPFSVALFAVAAIIFALILHRTTFGRYLFAIGNNENAAIYSGVPVARVKITIFVISGFMSALAGLILAARFASTRPDIGTGLELAVITTAVLGGVDINGGAGSMAGAVLSLVLIGLFRFGMGLLDIPGDEQGIAIGLLLILSILLPNVIQSIRGNRARVTGGQVAFIVAVIIILALFAVFFFWSRIPIITPS